MNGFIKSAACLVASFTIGIAILLTAPAQIREIWFEIVILIWLALIYLLPPVYIKNHLSPSELRENDKFSFYYIITGSILFGICAVVSSVVKIMT